tara:strand:+ start:606 stop:1073 length:468 start_codon:yes stop_codon:yes gene_type:complete
MKVYFAAPLFSQAEREFNTNVVERIEEHCTVYLPQRDGALMPNLIRGGASPDEAMAIVFKQDIEAIRRSNLIVVVLDGRSVDEGAAFELGVAWAMDKSIIGLRTDFRQLASFGNNPMIQTPIEVLADSIEELVEEIEKRALFAGSSEPHQFGQAG